MKIRKLVYFLLSFSSATATFSTAFMLSVGLPVSSISNQQQHHRLTAAFGLTKLAEIEVENLFKGELAAEHT